MSNNFFLIYPCVATNLFTNPSFENDLTGWTQVGTWASYTTDAWVGAKAAQCTALDTGVGSVYMSVTLTAATHWIQAMIKRSGGGAVSNSIALIKKGGSTVNFSSITHIQDGWYHCVGSTTTGAGATNIGITVLEADVVIDALMVETNTLWTTYLDGDLIGWRDIDGDDDTTGYAWSGTAHASTSTRHAQERSGGWVYDLEDLGVQVVNGFNGWGAPDPQHQIEAYALLPGAQYKGRRIPERVIDLPLTFYGADLETWHDNRLLLTDAVSVDLVEPNQPFTFRYSVGTTPKWLQIDGRYAGGLPGSTPNKTIEGANLRILAVNPYWRRLKQEVTSLTVNTPTAITNNGKQKALPRLVIEGTGSIDTLVNSTTGQTLTFNFFLNSGETFILDLENKTIVRKVGSTVTSILNAHVSGRINKWWLQRGSNTIQVTASATGILSTEDGDTLTIESNDRIITDGTYSITKCEIQFYEQFESADGISA